MTIVAQCGGCGRRYQVADHLAGKRVRCKGCGQPIAIPAAPAAVKTAAPASSKPPAPRATPPAAPAPVRLADDDPTPLERLEREMAASQGSKPAPVPGAGARATAPKRPVAQSGGAPTTSPRSAASTSGDSEPMSVLFDALDHQAPAAAPSAGERDIAVLPDVYASDEPADDLPAPAAAPRPRRPLLTRPSHVSDVTLGQILAAPFNGALFAQAGFIVIGAGVCIGLLFALLWGIGKLMPANVSMATARSLGFCLEIIVVLVGLSLAGWVTKKNFEVAESWYRDTSITPLERGTMVSFLQGWFIQATCFWPVLACKFLFPVQPILALGLLVAAIPWFVLYPALALGMCGAWNTVNPMRVIAVMIRQFPYYLLVAVVGAALLGVATVIMLVVGTFTGAALWGIGRNVRSENDAIALSVAIAIVGYLVVGTIVVSALLAQSAMVGVLLRREDPDREVGPAERTGGWVIGSISLVAAVFLAVQFSLPFLRQAGIIDVDTLMPWERMQYGPPPSWRESGPIPNAFGERPPAYYQRASVAANLSEVEALLGKGLPISAQEVPFGAGGDLRATQWYIWPDYSHPPDAPSMYYGGFDGAGRRQVWISR